METKFKSNSRKLLVSPNILEVRGSRIRIVSKREEKKK